MRIRIPKRYPERPFKLKPIKEYKKGELALVILKGLAVGGFIVAVMALPGLGVVFSLFQPKDYRERYRIRRTVSTLQRQQLIKVYKKRKGEVIGITERGKQKARRYDYENLAIAKVKKWDGLWRIIIFDIPETKRYARNAINRKFKELDLYPLQKSAFVTPHECKEEIDFIAEYWAVKKHIKYILAQDIEGSDELRKYFHIS